MKELFKPNYDVIILHDKEVVVNTTGAKFTVYYANLAMWDEDKNRAVAKPSKDGQIRTIKVALTGNTLKVVNDKGQGCPCVVAISPTKDYFITVDKDKDKKPRVDKDGNKHDIMIIRNIEPDNIAHLPMINRSLSDWDK